jgi:hypothetical protein
VRSSALGRPYGGDQEGEGRGNTRTCIYVSDPSLTRKLQKSFLLLFTFIYKGGNMGKIDESVKSAGKKFLSVVAIAVIFALVAIILW